MDTHTTALVVLTLMSGVFAFALHEYWRIRARLHFIENQYAAVMLWLRIKFPDFDRELKGIILKNGDGE